MSDTGMETSLVTGRSGSSGWRNWIGFWFLGLGVNFGFNIMLTAAHDILKVRQDGIGSVQNISLDLEPCNPLSTGTFLIADTVGALIGIAVAPFLLQNIATSLLLTAALSMSSYAITAFTTSDAMSFVGVFVGAFAAGFGEATVMSFAATYDKKIVSGYSAGMGAAGIFSSGAYLALTFFLTTKATLLSMLVVPILMWLNFWFVITPATMDNDARNNRNYTGEALDEEDKVLSSLSFAQKFKQLPSFLPTVIIPIFVSTFFMCFINQGLFELVNVDTIPLDRDVQYRLYITLFQVGIFVAQSSVQLLQIRKLWILSLLEGVCVLLVLGEILFPFHQIAPVVAVAIIEGIIGGATFVNTFYRISEESPEAATSFNMEIAMLANEAGAVAAGFLAIPTHNVLCAMLSK